MRRKKPKKHFRDLIAKNPLVSLKGYVVRHDNTKSYYVTNSSVIAGVMVHFGVKWKISYTDTDSSRIAKYRMRPLPEIVMFTVDQVKYLYTPDFSNVPQLVTENSPRPWTTDGKISHLFRHFTFKDRPDFIARFWNCDEKERQSFVSQAFVKIAQEQL